MSLLPDGKMDETYAQLKMIEDDLPAEVYLYSITSTQHNVMICLLYTSDAADE